MRRGSENLVAALALSAALALALPALAAADVGAKIIYRCTHGQSLGGFSQSDYKRALQEMPIEVREYSDCEELIQQAEIAAAGGRSGGAGGTGGAGGEEGGESGAIGNQPIQMTPEEQQAVASAATRAPSAVHISPGKGAVAPGVVHANIASAVSSVPKPLLAILALLLACGVAVGARTIRQRMPEGNDAAGGDHGED